MLKVFYYFFNLEEILIFLGIERFVGIFFFVVKCREVGIEYF